MVDAENHFHNKWIEDVCVNKKALIIVPVSTKEIATESWTFEIEVNNTVNKSQIEFDYFIQR